MFEDRQHFTHDPAEPAQLAGEMVQAAAPARDSAVPAPYLGFQLPRWVWTGMLGSYAVFFVAITVATGGSGHALFAIAVSILYTVMFFGLARAIARQAGPEQASPLARNQPLQTWCGPMEPGAVYGQILVVPAAIAFFAVAIAVIKAAVF